MPAPLIERIARAARRNRPLGLRTLHRDWTWAALLDDASTLAGALQSAGARPQSFVLLAMNRGAEFVLSLCAIKLAGGIPVIADPSEVLVWDRVVAQVRPSAIVLSARTTIPDFAALRDLRRQRDVRQIPLGNHAVECIPCPRPRRCEAAVSHVLFTSGTTSGIKGVVWSERRFAHDVARRVPVGCKPPDEGTSGILVPLSTALGFHELLRALWTGATCALIDEPLPAALDAMRALGVTGFQCTSTHAELMLSSAAPLPEALRRINVTSAPIGADRLLALARRVAPVLLSKSYGLTEVGPVCILRARAIPSKADTVGLPVSDRRVTVRDERGRILPPETEGEIVVEVAGWQEPDGYLTSDAQLRKRFSNGVLWTGDRGCFDADGYLVLRSRSSEMLKVAGRSISAAKIEAALRPLLGGAEVAVVGVPHPRLGQVPAAIYVPNTVAIAPATDRLTDALRADEIPRWLLPRRSLPLTRSGKLRRGLLEKEARGWASFWKHRLVVDDILWPARRLVREPAGEVFLVDGCPASWRRRLRVRERKAARIVTLARRAAGLEPIGVAFVQDGASPASAGIRIVISPGLVARSLVLTSLFRVAHLLPGPRVKALVLTGRSREAPTLRGYRRVRLGASCALWISRESAGAAVLRSLRRQRRAPPLSSLVRQLAAQLCRT